MNVEALWALIASVEAELPLQRDLLEAHFGTSFKGSLDHNKQPILVATTSAGDVELQAPSRGSEGRLTVTFATAVVVSRRLLLERFPDGYSVPPPPPGYAPADAEGAYIAQRAWGQIWFSLYSGDRIVAVTLLPGSHDSPGV